MWMSASVNSGRETPASCACFFFFSSRRRHTRFDCDWSSDVCSSDLVMQRHRRGTVYAMLPTDPDLIRLHTAAVALARSMRAEPDARRFVEGLSPHLREMIPHDRLLLIPADETPVPSPGSWLAPPLEGVDHAIGSRALPARAPPLYTEGHGTPARRVAG